MTLSRANRAYLLTPPGTGAIGVVRIVGPDADSIGRSVFRPAAHRADSSLQYGSFLDGEAILDEVIVSRPPRIASPALDICAHGGVRVIERILLVLERLGVPLESNAEDGGSHWPTQDAIEREVIHALSKAKTQRAVVFLAFQRRELPKAVRRIASMCERNPDETSCEIEHITRRFPAARTLLDGATVAIVGAVNSGKSTLFNRLVGRKAAVVSDEAGTTRDWVSAEIELEGVPLSLIDTAGRRRHAHPLEVDALAAVQERIATATIRLVLLDGAVNPSADEVDAIQTYRSHGPCLVVATKSDLPPAWDLGELTASVHVSKGSAVRVCAQSDHGIEDLSLALGAMLDTVTNLLETPVAFTPRQMGLLGHALSNVRSRGDLARQSLAQILGVE